MQLFGKRGGFILFFAGFLFANGCCQNLLWNDTVVVFNVGNRSDSGSSPVRFRLDQHLEYSLSCTALLFYNWQQGDNINIVSLFHHFNYRAHVTSGRHVKISNSFNHELGIQYFFDSITRFKPDENTLDTRVDVSIRKNISFAVFSNLATPVFNSYIFSTDRAGNLRKTICSSFLTPLVWTFSSGFGWNFLRLGALSVGLSSAKITWILNRAVFSQQNVIEFYGVPKEKGHTFEYGLSMHLMIDKEFLKRGRWSCDLLIFKNFRKPVDLVMRNQVSVRINKFLKASIQTRLYYEKETSKNIQMENLVSLGFFFNL